MTRSPPASASAGPGPQPDAAVAGVVPSWWDTVARRFRRSRLSRLALGVAALFFAMAALAPVISHRAPLVYRSRDGLEFPVFAEFIGADVCWLGLVIVFVVARLVGAIVHRRLRGRLEAWRRARRTLVVGAVLAFAAVCAGGLAIPARIHADRWDDLEPAAGEWVVWTPVGHHPSADFDLDARLAPPSIRHPLGTDDAGRDVLARLLYGSRISLVVGFVSMSIALVLGVVVGAVAGYFGGWVDLILTRFIEVVLCFPSLFLILIVLAYLPPSIFNIMALIGLLGWTGVARLTRGEFLRLRHQEFVLAARALGAGHLRIIVRHLLPNALAPVLVAATFGIAGAMLTEAALSFLGLGVPEPTPSWGQMLQGGRASLTVAPWLTIFPGLMIFLAVTAYNVVGEGLRDALDPRLKR